MLRPFFNKLMYVNGNFTSIGDLESCIDSLLIVLILLATLFDSVSVRDHFQISLLISSEFMRI